MNKSSHKPKAAHRKGIATPVEQRDEVFFQTIKPLVHGSAFLVEMSSGTHVEQNAYLDLDLLELHIEQLQKQHAEIISIKHILNTELPQQTLELIRVFQKAPDDLKKSTQHFPFNILVMDDSTHGAQGSADAARPS